MRWRKVVKEARDKEFNGWEQWFAWYPVEVEEIYGSKYTVWWEVVRRKAFYFHFHVRGDCPHHYHYFRYQFDDEFNESLGDKAPPPMPYVKPAKDSCCGGSCDV